MSQIIVPAEYTADDTREAYRSGWNHGHGIACHNVPKLGAKLFLEDLGRVTVDAENIREVHQSACYAAAENSRQYSPFEFTAKEFNDCGDGGFRIANGDTENEGVMFDTIEEAERAAVDEGYTLVREYVWEASGFYVPVPPNEAADSGQWDVDALDWLAKQVFPTVSEARHGARDACLSVAIIDEISSSEELWEAFEAGTSAAIQADLETYDDSDYGIEPDDSDC